MTDQRLACDRSWIHQVVVALLMLFVVVSWRGILLLLQSGALLVRIAEVGVVLLKMVLGLLERALGGRVYASIRDTTHCHCTD